jgi:hypothetical protein
LFAASFVRNKKTLVMPAIIRFEKLFSERDYLAPTVYKKDGVGIPSGYNYYGTLNQAQQKFLFLNNRGGYNSAPVGYKTFPNTAVQTFGINVDFYVYNNGNWILTPYSELRNTNLGQGIVFRFYLTDGSGPYYSIFDNKLFGISATAIDSVSSEKLAALDAYYREVALLKYRYNNLVGFLNELAKKQLNPKEQQIFNEGMLKLQNMQQQISTLKGIEISYTANGAVIGLPILLIIAVIAILAAVAGWTITEIMGMKEKTKQINDSYNLTMWVASKKQEVAMQATAGTITQSQADGINKTLDDATELANKVAQNASKDNSGGIFSNLATLVKWGAIGFLGYKAFQLAGTYRQNKAQ